MRVQVLFWFCLYKEVGLESDSTRLHPSEHDIYVFALCSPSCILGEGIGGILFATLSTAYFDF